LNGEFWIWNNFLYTNIIECILILMIFLIFEFLVCFKKLKFIHSIFDLYIVVGLILKDFNLKFSKIFFHLIYCIVYFYIRGNWYVLKFQIYSFHVMLLYMILWWYHLNSHYNFFLFIFFHTIHHSDILYLPIFFNKIFLVILFFIPLHCRYNICCIFFLTSIPPCIFNQ